MKLKFEKAISKSNAISLLMLPFVYVGIGVHWVLFEKVLSHTQYNWILSGISLVFAPLGKIVNYFDSFGKFNDTKGLLLFFIVLMAWPVYFIANTIFFVVL